MERFDDYLKDVLKDEKTFDEYIEEILRQYYIDGNSALFWSSIKNAMKAHSSICDISKAAKISKQHVYKILSNKCSPSFDNAVAILAALGLRISVQFNNSKCKSV